MKAGGVAVGPAPRNIAVFIDGTWNRQGTPTSTNVRKLYEASAAGLVNGREQSKLYVSGVGTMPAVDAVGLLDRGRRQRLALHLERELPPGTAWARPVLGGAFGTGTTARIKAMYSAICRDFDRFRGDRLFLFGFSRGAFAARSLAGFLEKVGLLLRERLDHVDEAYALYESSQDPAQSALAAWLYRLTGQRMPGPDDAAWLPVHFLGVWDTVGALGLPSRLAWLSAPFTEYHQVTVPPNVMHGRHALALHELRAAFEPLPWRGQGHPSLEQLWFPGAHADVGGGYRNGETGLSDAALAWMANEAESKGLAVDRRSEWLAGEPAPRRIHHEIRGLFFATMPAVRRCLDSGHVAGPSRIGFHETSREHLFASPRPAHANGGPDVNAALRRVDEIAAPLIVLAGLKRSGLATAGQAVAAGDERPEADWWKSVTLDELSGSGALASSLREPRAANRGANVLQGATAMQDATIAQDVSIARAARALAIQQLCFDRETLPAAVRDAAKATGQFIASLRSQEDLAEAKAWFDHCEPFGLIFRRCRELIVAPRDAGADGGLARFIDTALDEFGSQVKKLRDVLIERDISSGTGKELVMPVTRFR